MTRFPGELIIKKALVLYLEHNRESFCGCAGCCDIRVRLFPREAFSYYIETVRDGELIHTPYYPERPEAREATQGVGPIGQFRLAFADLLDTIGDLLKDTSSDIREDVRKNHG